MLSGLAVTPIGVNVRIAIVTYPIAIEVGLVRVGDRRAVVGHLQVGTLHIATQVVQERPE